MTIHKCHWCKTALPEGRKGPRYCSQLCMDKTHAHSRAWHSQNPERSRKSMAAWRAAHPTYMKEYDLWHKYGLTPEAVDALLAAQGGHCAICPATEPGGRGWWHIDHRHANDYDALPPDERRALVRGVLCANCNLMLGHARDNPATLISGAAYLTRS